MKIKVNFKSIIIAVYYFLLFCLLVLPSLKYSVKYVPIILFSVPLIGLYSVSYKKGFQKFLMVAAALVMMFVFSFLVNSTFRLSQSINFSIVTYLCFLPFFMFDYLSNGNDKTEMKLALILALFVYIYIFIVTSRELSVNPVVARMLATGDNEDEYINALRNRNVGGYGFAYAISMFIPYVATKIMTAKGKDKALLSILLIVLLVFALYCQYTTLIILTVAACFIIFVIYSKNYLAKGLLLLVGIVSIFSMSYIFRFLAFNLPLESLANHFHSLYISMSLDGETVSRLEYTRACIVMFIKHPIFGVDLTDTYNAYYVNHGHSTYFPILASKGIVGASLYFGITGFVIKSIFNKLGKNKAVISVFVYYIVLGFLNPISAFEISVVIFFIIPLIEYMSLQNKKEKMQHVRT